MTAPRLVIVGSGFGGLVGALAAHHAGLDVVVLEKGTWVGGATVFSGGQVWVAGNHLEPGLGIDDDPAAGADYVRELTAHRPDDLDATVMAEWLEAAPGVARWLEGQGGVAWEVIPDFPDYAYPAAAGSRPAGRYLTSAPVELDRLGAHRDLLPPAPHFPSGITYAELFAWGGQASRRNWDLDLLAERRRRGVATFGHALTAGILAALLDRGVQVVTDAAVTGLEVADGAVVGVRARIGGRDAVEHGAVLLASGSYDWDPALVERYSGMPPGTSGSVGPPTLTGDAFRLGAEVDAAVAAMAPESAARLPALTWAPAFPGDTGERQCHEHGLPHAIVVDATGQRFCDDAFPSAITAAVVGNRRPDGSSAHLPFFMIVDDRHRQRYGLVDVPPGGTYPEGTVASADRIADLARQLGIDPDGLVATVARYNRHAAHGQDPDFDRGGRPWSQKFKGDLEHRPHPNIGTLEVPPFHGIELHLDMTGIPAAGLRTTTRARVVDRAGAPIPGLYATGSCTAMTNSGSGYNSGFSLSRAMTGAWLAVRDLTDR